MDLTRTAFKLDGESVSIGEVLAAAYLGGWSRPLERRVHDGLVAASRADDEDIDIPAEDIEVFLDHWRRDRDLIAAEELEAWLGARELTVEELCDHLERAALVRHEWSAAPDDVEEPEVSDVLEILPAEAAFGGELEALTEQFARRCVATLADGDAATLAAKRSRVRGEILAERGKGGLDDLEEVGDAFGVAPPRLAALLDIEVDFRLFREEAAAFQRLKAALVEFRDQLVRFDIITAACPTEDMAREVLCWIHVDRDPFTRSVARAGLECRKEAVFASDVGSVPFGHRFQAAQEREVFGPAPIGHAHVVAQLLERHDPDLSTPGVAEWLAERLVDRALRRHLSERVRFPEPEAS